MTCDIFEGKGIELRVASPARPFIWRGTGGDAYGEVPRRRSLRAGGAPEGADGPGSAGVTVSEGVLGPWPGAGNGGMRWKSRAGRTGSLQRSGQRILKLRRNRLYEPEC